MHVLFHVAVSKTGYIESHGSVAAGLQPTAGEFKHLSMKMFAVPTLGNVVSVTVARGCLRFASHKMRNLYSYKI